MGPWLTVPAASEDFTPSASKLSGTCIKCLSTSFSLLGSCLTCSQRYLSMYVSQKCGVESWMVNGVRGITGNPSVLKEVAA